MSTQEVFVQQFTRLFDHYQEALSPQERRDAETQPAMWAAIPPHERDRIIAAARLAILELETNGRPEEMTRRYFSKPGEAEWGC
ncbi:MAG TPA: hypothetical protein VL240_03950 [Candidatus Binatia bacterium]|nr:hypothetical protein [Candidatus Binatia bacterium]